MSVEQHTVLGKEEEVNIFLGSVEEIDNGKGHEGSQRDLQGFLHMPS
jgi:hypothetical protein